MTKTTTEQDYDHATADVFERMRSQASLAELAMKALLIAHGGALVALFTLVGALGDRKSAMSFDPSRLWWAFGLFAGGLGLALFAHLAAFMSQHCYFQQGHRERWRYQAALESGESPAAHGPEELAYFAAGNRWYHGGLALWATSAIAFVIGCGVALAAFMPA